LQPGEFGAVQAGLKLNLTRAKNRAKN